ncbi:MAG: Phosphate-specific transport system accessory protein PhoU [Firmicutes bacterium]|nr:Phosphate-specific transport system accessory protein PhoU [candidate division NPL-UPA2 bacterium]MBT9156315.1 Phosphate-specific transport system accessory protein PhoU [candidate division NPL-UPA2 bacterium]
MLRKSFQKELDDLHARLLAMGGRIEQMLHLALDTLRTGNEQAANQVEEMEILIDEMAAEIDALAIELIAKQQPVGKDLRRIIGAMRLAVDMERVADISTNIVEQSRLLPRPLIKPLIDIPKMVDVAAGMLQDSLNALINSDVNLAIDVWKRDDVVDELCERIVVELRGMMTADGTIVPKALPLLIIAIQIERIADHATNLAESVMFIATGNRVVTL